jgi:hypothetical protein
MKTTVFALMTALLIPTAFAKASLSLDEQKNVLALDRTENAAYVKLQQAEQDELMGKISPTELETIRHEYDVAKNSLQGALSELPNRAEIEQWLIDNHVRVGE